MADWHTYTSVKEQWKNAPSQTITEELLEVAKSRILSRGTLEYTVDEETEGEIPVEYRLGQRLYVQYLWEAQNGNTASEVDVIGGEYQVRTKAVPPTILDLIAPKVPRIG